MAVAVKIVVFVPDSHADAVRQAMGQAGAGVVGNYGFCTFSAPGIGRFVPLEGANPTVGQVGQLEEVEEQRIETVCLRERLFDVLKAVVDVHPYEQPAIDVYPLEDLDFLSKLENI